MHDPCRLFFSPADTPNIRSHVSSDNDDWRQKGDQCEKVEMEKERKRVSEPRSGRTKVGISVTRHKRGVESEEPLHRQHSAGKRQKPLLLLVYFKCSAIPLLQQQSTAVHLLYNSSVSRTRSEQSLKSV